MLLRKKIMQFDYFSFLPDVIKDLVHIINKQLPDKKLQYTEILYLPKKRQRCRFGFLVKHAPRLGFSILMHTV